MTPVILSWQGFTRSVTADQGDVGVKVFSVVGASDPDDVVSLVSSVANVTVNTPWNADDPNNILLCQSVVPNFSGPILSTATATFSVPPRGYFQISVKPTALPWKYLWGNSVESEPLDRDVDNNPILNAAGDPPSSPLTKTIVKKTLRITMYPTFYDYATWREYEQCVSSDDIDLIQPDGQTTTFPAGTIKCQTITPAQDYTANDTVLPIYVDVEMYDLEVINPDMHDPWQEHLLNAGSSAYYLSTDGTKKKGPILYASNGEVVSSDVPLDQYGKPIDTTLMVQGDGGAPVAPVNAPSPNPPTGSTVENVGSGTYSVTFLVWQKCRKVPFLPLFTPGALF